MGFAGIRARMLIVRGMLGYDLEGGMLERGGLEGRVVNQLLCCGWRGWCLLKGAEGGSLASSWL